MIRVMNRMLLIVFLIALVAIAGCTTVQDVVMDATQEDDSLVDADPVKIVMFIDYPIGGKDAYIAWVSSVASTLQAPEEVKRIRSYDNVDQTMSPNRLVEFEFDSFLDSATYLNRPEISDVLLEIPNQTSNADAHIYNERSYYEKTDESDYPIKFISLIDFPLGGKDAYLAWVSSISSTLVDPPQVKAISSYDNYYGESPHRLFTIEFSSQEDADTYEALEEVQAIEDELDDRAGSWSSHTFELRSDYINE
ncbi:hypothetical protein F4X73_06885 [Candidatus Poribacteria bacterium]|nr:hypothetical protein [Candidatus Poribacteria bacterium]